MFAMTEFKIGDPVEVIDEGLAILRNYAHPSAPPNNHGRVHEIWEDGTILVEFPIGDFKKDPDAHSQVAPYEPHLVKHRHE